MKNLRALAVLATAILSAPATAGLINGTGNVNPDVIFGSGNTNGSFTGVTENDIELGLRGKLRYNTSGIPEATYNYDGDKTYTFVPADGNAPADRSLFNFDWSINVDPFSSISPTTMLDDLTYILQIDYDPTAATDFFQFDPINIPYADHAIGTNATGNGGGTKAPSGNSAAYQALIAGNNVAQNSWNLGFFEPLGFDPQTQGQYTINLMAYRQGSLQASTSIDIIFGAVPVPAPSAFLLMLTGLAGLGFASKRRLKR